MGERLIYVLNSETQTATLGGRSGLAADKQAVPERIARDGASIWPIIDALDSGRSRVVSDLSALPDRLPVVRGVFQPMQAVILPLLMREPRATAAGVLSVGLSPLRRYDNDYQQFLELVAGVISAAIRNAQLPHEGGRIAAAREPTYVSSFTRGLLVDWP